MQPLRPGATPSVPEPAMRPRHRALEALLHVSNHYGQLIPSIGHQPPWLAPLRWVLERTGLSYTVIEDIRESPNRVTPSMTRSPQTGYQLVLTHNSFLISST